MHRGSRNESFEVTFDFKKLLRFVSWIFSYRCIIHHESCSKYKLHDINTFRGHVDAAVRDKQPPFAYHVRTIRAPYAKKVLSEYEGLSLRCRGARARSHLLDE